ncbi:hypothetical protein SDC9_137356 [bioreactor metagenome]|uniref:Uncharacterized protein n=1 Tax=bioreactor metagenome TaxID=1076179 RepID=A0A645DLV0_9ZZZZ
MDYFFCFRAELSICVNMSHDVMTDFFFASFSDVIIYIIQMRGKLVDLLIRNIYAELLFGFSQGKPKPSERTEFEVLRKNMKHFRA